MKLPLMILATLGTALFLPACDDEPEHRPQTYDEQVQDAFHQAMKKRQDDARDERRRLQDSRQENINAFDWYGRTELSRASEELYDHEDRLSDALRDEDAESAADHRKEVAELKAAIREQLKAGADPWARSVSQYDGMLAPCAIQYWSAAFIAELRADGFTISATPDTTPAP